VDVTGVDYDAEAERYQAGRGVPVETLAPWRAELTAYLPNGRSPLLDLGAGTGIWTRALASWFNLGIVALEPSAGMRSVAAQVGIPTKASYVAGIAEALPFGGATFGAAWLSTVLHHLSDLSTSARELRRVLTEGAPVLVRNSFPGRHEEVELFKHFPAAAAVAARWPSLDEVVSKFAEAGFARSRVVRVREGRWRDLQRMRDWALSMRYTDSTLAPLSDDEFAQGLRNIDAAIARGERPRRMGVDFVTFT
jgi:SAM-dependent methyltransferase